MNALIVVGAGGHARSLLDILLGNGNFSHIACVDAAYPEIDHVQGYPSVKVIGRDENLPTIYAAGFGHALIALGNNRLRRSLFLQAFEIGFQFVNAISRYAIVSERAEIGKGSCVMPGAVVNAGAVIGENCIINTRCSIDHDCQIGAHCHIAPGVTLSGGVTIGEGTQVGTGASVTDRVRIGDWSLIGAGSTVVRDIDSRIVAYGIPAKYVRAVKE